MASNTSWCPHCQRLPRKPTWNQSWPLICQSHYRLFLVRTHSLFSLTVTSNSKFKNTLKIWKEHFSHGRINHPKAIPKPGEELNQSSLKQTKAHTISAVFSQWEQKADGVHGCENKLLTLKILLPLTQESQQVTVVFLQPPTVKTQEHLPGSACGIQTLLCFICCTTKQLCRTMWFTYCQLLYLHRATLLLLAVGSFKKGQTRDYHSEIIGFFLCAQSHAWGHPHSHSWGELGLQAGDFGFQPHTQFLELSGNSAGGGGETGADFPQMAPWTSPKMNWQQEKPPYTLILFSSNDQITNL